jgi:hypothetical protein
MHHTHASIPNNEADCPLVSLAKLQWALKIIDLRINLNYSLQIRAFEIKLAQLSKSRG